MNELCKIIKVCNPNMTFFVGEALAGNESSDQSRKFHESLDKEVGKGIDGIILTKFDCVDNKIGTAVSMVYEIGRPIYFLGVGEKYNDIQVPSSDDIIERLMEKG